MIQHARRSEDPRPPPRRGPGRAFATTEGDESPRAPSDRTVSEYMIANERLGVPGRSTDYNTAGRSGDYNTNERPGRSGDYNSTERPGRSGDYSTADRAGRSGDYNTADRMARAGPPSHRSRGDNNSDIYVSSAYRAPSEFSRSSYPRSEAHSVRSKVSRKMGAEIETVATPSPFCPDTRGICCLMLLLNLGIMLVTLGFIVVIQFHDPLFIWILGIVFLVFGFITLIGSLVYCVYVCRDARHPSDVNPDDLYWKHRWTTRVGSPEIHYRTEDRFPDDDRSGISKLSSRRSERY